ncbi:MAG TPA: hypothetical protein VMW42_06350 [Desulfatiglandales bacterium]|nr:hypothetical protein [Desulfatiglandales bacterium]
MKTLDGYILHDGDDCFVKCVDPMGESKLSPNARKAFYRDENARAIGWDFTIANLRVDCEVEVTHVWKNNPDKPPEQPESRGEGDSD